jgi:hypothetical protein
MRSFTSNLVDELVASFLQVHVGRGEAIISVGFCGPRTMLHHVFQGSGGIVAEVGCNFLQGQTSGFLWSDQSEVPCATDGEGMLTGQKKNSVSDPTKAGNIRTK